ncbi:hypothetical protein GMSM_44480 [Geomonas sp. Red276]
MATKIRILPENLTNKIAAGEVVERPASVAKELVENALDAGTREVVVEIEGGGRKLIRISDTGCGMSREDALLALERHATSKIATDADLFSLSTLGFRGEALPSIASVSRLTIATRTPDSVEGTEIYAEGGRIKEVKECGMAAGTVIAVRNLFFNTPARLKFMKSAETEGGHVGELLTRLAISRPDVRFTYLNDGKQVFRALDSDLKTRVATMLGRQIAGFLHPVSYQDDSGLKVSGLVAAPECSRSAGSHLYTYINGRFIRDKVVQHAVLQAYRNFMERGRYPVVALFIDIDPGEVDVNVHPTKHEVRFREQGRVHDAIQFAVESVLKETPWLIRQPVARSGSAGSSVTSPTSASAAKPAASGVTASPAASVSRGNWPTSSTGAPSTRPSQSPLPLASADKKEAATTGEREPAPGEAGAPVSAASTGAAISDVSAARVAEVRELLVNYQPRPQPALRPHFQPSPDKAAAKGGEDAFPPPAQQSGTEPGSAGSEPGSEMGRGASRPAVNREPTKEPLPGTGTFEATPPPAGVAEPAERTGPAGATPPPEPIAAPEPLPAQEESAQGYFSSLAVIGQFNASYILCQHGTDLVLIDQHAAHERVAFEKLKGELAAREVDSQGLLFPEPIELSYQESAVLKEHLEELGRLGFEIDEFGGNTWLLKGVPQILSSTGYLRTLRDILEELGSLGRSRSFTDVQEDLLARIACHSVVRGRRPLSRQEITALFRQMDQTDFSSNCPHGRPVMQRLTLSEVEKMFKRV